MVMDPHSDTFPVPQERDVGNGMVIREIHQAPYPLFVKIDGGGMASSSVITSGLAGSVMHWASPVKADAKVGDDAHKVDVLLRSSEDSWLTSSTNAQPNPTQYPELGFPGPAKDLAADKKGSQVLAVTVVGGFTSSLEQPKDKPAGAPAPSAADKDASARRIAHSPPDSRIAVFGSSAFASDLLIEQLDSDFTKSNIELIHNAVDWSLADTDLLGIRSRNTAARALTASPEAREHWRTLIFVVCLLGLAAVVVFATVRRRGVQPILSKEA
jgi:hypothetical protein